MVTTFTQKGQITVPAPIRRQFGIRRGTRALVEFEEGKIVVRPLKAGIRALAGSLKTKRRASSWRKVREETLTKVVRDIVRQGR